VNVVKSKEIRLTATTGRGTGTAGARQVRSEGDVPGVVYGMNQDAVAVSVPWPELRRALSTDAGQNVLISLDVDGDRSLSMVTDLQRHPVRRDVIHVDFLRIDPNTPIAVDIPVVLTGKADAVEQSKGMIDQLMYTVTIKARPDAIPNQVEADISHLEIGTGLTVGELVLPEGVEAAVDPEEVVATGSPTRSTIIMQQEEARAARIAAGEATEEDLAFLAGEEGGGGGDDAGAAPAGGDGD
jgi:large subunit ribosomal protein L25